MYVFWCHVMESRENPPFGWIDSEHIFIKYILRENSPFGRINSVYIILQIIYNKKRSNRLKKPYGGDFFKIFPRRVS